MTKFDGRQVIVNVLWHLTPEKSTEQVQLCVAVDVSSRIKAMHTTSSR